MTKQLGFDAEILTEALTVLLVPGSTAEVRILKAEKYQTVSGYFDNVPAIIKELESFRHIGEGTYFTLNEVTRSLLARSKNRLKPWATSTTADVDIARIRWI